MNNSFNNTNVYLNIISITNHLFNKKPNHRISPGLSYHHQPYFHQAKVRCSYDMYVRACVFCFMLTCSLSPTFLSYLAGLLEPLRLAATQPMTKTSEPIKFKPPFVLWSYAFLMFQTKQSSSRSMVFSVSKSEKRTPTGK